MLTIELRKSEFSPHFNILQVNILIVELSELRARGSELRARHDDDVIDRVITEISGVNTEEAAKTTAILRVMTEEPAK